MTTPKHTLISAKNAIIMDVLDECIKAMEAAHESMFTQCLSNPVYNAWGKQVNLTEQNNMIQVAMNAKAILTSHRGSPNVG